MNYSLLYLHLVFIFNFVSTIETVFVKQEKEDDYEKTVSVKQEDIPANEAVEEESDRLNADRTDRTEDDNVTEKSPTKDDVPSNDVTEEFENNKIETPAEDADEMNDAIDHSVY